jgi:hypothetical protein
VQVEACNSWWGKYNVKMIKVCSAQPEQNKVLMRRKMDSFSRSRSAHCLSWFKLFKASALSVNLVLHYCLLIHLVFECIIAGRGMVSGHMQRGGASGGGFGGMEASDCFLCPPGKLSHTVTAGASCTDCPAGKCSDSLVILSFKKTS